MQPILQKVDIEHAQSIIAFTYTKANFEAPWHFHPQHELIFVDASVGTKFVGDSVTSYQPGELVLLGSNLPHCWKTMPGQETNAESTVIMWDPKLYGQAPELADLVKMINLSAYGLFFARSDIEHLIPKIQDLPKLTGSQLYVELLTLLLSLSSCPSESLSESKFHHVLPSKFGSRLAKVQDFVHLNYDRKIYLKDLARLVNMSEQSFSRFFSKMMGRPFFTFLNEYRINMASRMLLDSDWSVSEIAFHCGFESKPFFYKQFHRFKVVTPLEFRKAHLNKIYATALKEHADD